MDVSVSRRIKKEAKAAKKAAAKAAKKAAKEMRQMAKWKDRGHPTYFLF